MRVVLPPRTLEALRRLIRERGRLDPLLVEPPAQVRHQPDVVLHRRRPVAALGQPQPKARRVGRQNAFHPRDRQSPHTLKARQPAAIMKTTPRLDAARCADFHPEVGITTRSAQIASCRRRHEAIFSTTRVRKAVRTASTGATGGPRRGVLRTRLNRPRIGPRPSIDTTLLLIYRGLLAIAPDRANRSPDMTPRTEAAPTVLTPDVLVVWTGCERGMRVVPQSSPPTALPR